MTANLTGKSQIRSQDTQNIVNELQKLSTDNQLALLYWIYEKMGDSITPAAPGAAEPNIAPMLMDDYYKLSEDEQLQIMRDIVERKDTVYSHAYGALSANNQL
ncbi:MAG: orange carotenoid protein N-terminal domain-containing protein, partial [Planktothrix sp.]